MDHTKLDSALAAALGASQDPEAANLTVFVHTEGPLGTSEVGFLQSLGIEPRQAREIVTAKLSPKGIERLSDQPWVRSIRLARNLSLRNP